MFIEFNGLILNTFNVISFREGTVDKQGKYPIYADHVMHDTGTDDSYKETYDTKELQDERFAELKEMLINNG